MSLGERLNNPFDLRDEGIAWEGREGESAGFVIFDTLEHGLRAGLRDLHTKWKRDGLNTIHDIVEKYAPPSENDTTAYIAGVCASTGWNEYDPLNLDNPDNLKALGLAVLTQEQGHAYILTLRNNADFDQAVSEALA